MNILIIAPTFGGINVYTEILSKELKLLGNNVDSIGSTLDDNPYDVENKRWRDIKWVKERIEKIYKRIDFSKYDLALFHYGKNDIEQYIPVLMRSNKKNIKSIYFVHYLSHNLFSEYLNDTNTQEKVELASKEFFDGYIFFGSFAKNYLKNSVRNHANSIVSFIPETHSQYANNDKPKVEIQELLGLSNLDNVVFITGYASNYKDYSTLLQSLIYVNKPFNLVFVGRGWISRLGFEKKMIGNVNVYVIDKEIPPEEFKFFVDNSIFGIFPYKQPLNCDEVFQGSGVLPNYIFSGKGVIAFNEGCLKEYIGNAGIVLDKYTPLNLARAINQMLDEKHRKVFEKEARKIIDRFSPKNHAVECNKFFLNQNIL